MTVGHDFALRCDGDLGRLIETCDLCFVAVKSFTSSIGIGLSVVCNVVMGSFLQRHAASTSEKRLSPQISSYGGEKCRAEDDFQPTLFDKAGAVYER